MRSPDPKQGLRFWGFGGHFTVLYLTVVWQGVPCAFKPPLLESKSFSLSTAVAKLGLCHPFSHSTSQTREVLTWHEGARDTPPRPPAHHQFLLPGSTNSSGAQITAQGQGTVTEQAGQGGCGPAPCSPHISSCFFNKMLEQLREQRDQHPRAVVRLLCCLPDHVTVPPGDLEFWSPSLVEKLVPQGGPASPGFSGGSHLRRTELHRCSQQFQGL